jgi:two-component system, OmpR family, phosphate regulon response regulator PhoB
MVRGMSENVQVLVVEDEPDIRNLVALNLRRAGFDVLTAETGTAGLELARLHVPPLVLLDLMLPDLSGTEVCARLRANEATRHLHVIMVTARGDEGDRITGFEVGADDYVTKPFSVKELVLRVKAAARKIESHRAFVDNIEVQLTATEYKLLYCLAAEPGRMQSRGELLVEVWDLPPTLNTRTVDTHIKRLRQKLGGACDYVETVRGAGYRFSPTEGS